MRFLRRLNSPPTVESLPPSAGTAKPAERRRVPFKCRACGRVRPPYVYAENAHHYCLECARRSWKLMRLKPVARRIGDQPLGAIVMNEDAH